MTVCTKSARPSEEHPRLSRYEDVVVGQWEFSKSAPLLWRHCIRMRNSWSYMEM